MSPRTVEIQRAIEDIYFKKLYRKHYQGALVRSGGSAFMWCAALIAYSQDLIKRPHITGVSVSVLFLILMNLPTLYVLRHIQSKTIFKLFSILIHIFEVIGYTAVIYFLGGIEAIYLTPIYAILISYLGIVASRSMPFLVAGLCSICLSLMVLGEHFGIIPHQTVLHELSLYYPFKNQLVILLVVIALLHILAYTSSYTAKFLKKSKKELRRQNEELIEARAAAEKATQAKSEFLASMSHELRTPLNHIIGFTELVVDRNVGDLNETQEEYLNDVLSSGKHLLSLINDILDLSKIEAGKMELQLSDVNVRDVLNKGIAMVKEKALKHNIQVSLDVDGIPEIIRADERKIRQVLYNLLSNAVKFTPDGGRVSIDAKKSAYRARSGKPWETPAGTKILEKTVEAKKAGDLDIIPCMEISVSDTGIGISHEDLEKVFKPFEQVESTANRRYQGTGLGLSLSKTLVELHGGKIWAKSDGEGKGSKFKFVIPI